MIDTTRRDQLIDQIAGALQRLRADLSSALNDLETLHHVVYGLPPAPTEWTVEPARPGSAPARLVATIPGGSVSGVINALAAERYGWEYVARIARQLTKATE